MCREKILNLTDTSNIFLSLGAGLDMVSESSEMTKSKKAQLASN
jgi:hypothetical protein